MKQRVLTGVLLACLTMMAHGGVVGNDFVEIGDVPYVTENIHVNTGLTLDNVIWAFTSVYESSWHPLTWMSHMLDCQIFGLDPKWHHLMSLGIHLAGALVLFSVLARMTGDVWRSAFVAALFSVHPINVESIAWVAQRKSVLSTLSWILTLRAYARYVEFPTRWQYVRVALCLAMGLLSKAVLITLPVVLLLLDYWPLKRLSVQTFARCVYEKIPLFVLASASTLIAYLVHTFSGSTPSLGTLPPAERISEGIVSYLIYLSHLFWPVGLSVVYPTDAHSIPFWKVAVAVAALGTISALAVYSVRRHPYLSVGWFWYAAALAPMIGIGQVESQSMADRYAYVPFIGLYLVIAWAVPDILEKCRKKKAILIILAAVTLFTCVGLCRIQVRHWKNSHTLFQHASSVTPDNPAALEGIRLR